MIAVPSVLFDGVTIQSAPGHRPIGGGGAVPTEYDNLQNAPIKINKRSKNGWIGSSAKEIVKDNQFDYNHFDPTKGTPLSQFAQVGNRGDVALTIPVSMDQPGNDAMAQVMRVLNGKVEGEMESLSEEQKRFLQAKSKPSEPVKSPEGQLISDYGDALHEMTKQQRIRNAVAQGFTEQEAKEAYERLRRSEAELALMKMENPSNRLYDIIDSRGSGVDRREPGNNESAINLAMGGSGNPRAPPHEMMLKRKPRGKGVFYSSELQEMEQLMGRDRNQSRLDDFFGK